MSGVNNSAPGFSGIFELTQNNIENEMESLVEEIFKDIWNQVKKILGDEYREVMKGIPEEQKQQIKEYLLKGAIQGGTRENDRPWGLEKIVEETRRRILCSVIRESTPPYRSGENKKTAEEYIHDVIYPLHEKFVIPQGYLAYSSPAAFSARRRQKSEKL